MDLVERGKNEFLGDVGGCFGFGLWLAWTQVFEKSIARVA